MMNEQKIMNLLSMAQRAGRVASGDFAVTKAVSKRYNRVLPNDISKFRKQPKDEVLPILDLTPVKEKELSYFPEGIYAQVSSISDIFAVQGLNPVRLILEYNSETSYDLLNHKTVLPFSKKQIFISLDPFCSAA